jgi:hypothetical protein
VAPLTPAALLVAHNRRVSTVRHVIGPTWHQGTPGLRVWVPNDDGQEGTLDTLLLSGELCMTPLPDRSCIGHFSYERGERVPCPFSSSKSPYGTPVSNASAQCDRCRLDEGTYLCLTCDGSRCPILPPALLERCVRPHRLYLMDFGTGSVKVGTSAEGRAQERVIEQGPIAAALIAAGPGPTIKRLERAASSLGTTERVRRTRKGAVAFRAADEPLARRRIEEAFERISAGIRSGRAHGSSGSSGSTARDYAARSELPGPVFGETGGLISEEDAASLHDPQFVMLPSPEPARLNAPLHQIAVRPGQTIRGPILEVRGGFALLDVMGLPGLLDLAALRGWLVDLKPADATPPPPVQLPLLAF